MLSRSSSLLKCLLTVVCLANHFASGIVWSTFISRPLTKEASSRNPTWSSNPVAISRRSDSGKRHVMTGRLSSSGIPYASAVKQRGRQEESRFALPSGRRTRARPAQPSQSRTKSRRQVGPPQSDNWGQDTRTFGGFEDTIDVQNGQELAAVAERRSSEIDQIALPQEQVQQFRPHPSGFQQQRPNQFVQNLPQQQSLVGGFSQVPNGFQPSGRPPPGGGGPAHVRHLNQLLGSNRPTNRPTPGFQVNNDNLQPLGRPPASPGAQHGFNQQSTLGPGPFNGAAQQQRPGQQLNPQNQRPFVPGQPQARAPPPPSSQNQFVRNQQPPFPSQFQSTPPVFSQTATSQQGFRPNTHNPNQQQGFRPNTHNPNQLRQNQQLEGDPDFDDFFQFDQQEGDDEEVDPEGRDLPIEELLNDVPTDHQRQLNAIVNNKLRPQLNLQVAESMRAKQRQLQQIQRLVGQQPIGKPGFLGGRNTVGPPPVKISTESQDDRLKKLKSEQLQFGRALKQRPLTAIPANDVPTFIASAGTSQSNHRDRPTTPTQQSVDPQRRTSARQISPGSQGPTVPSPTLSPPRPPQNLAQAGSSIRPTIAQKANFNQNTTFRPTNPVPGSPQTRQLPTTQGFIQQRNPPLNNRPAQPPGRPGGPSTAQRPLGSATQGPTQFQPNSNTAFAQQETRVHGGSTTTQQGQQQSTNVNGGFRPVQPPGHLTIPPIPTTLIPPAFRLGTPHPVFSLMNTPSGGQRTHSRPDVLLGSATSRPATGKFSAPAPQPKTFGSPANSVVTVGKETHGDGWQPLTGPGGAHADPQVPGQPARQFNAVLRNLPVSPELSRPITPRPTPSPGFRVTSPEPVFPGSVTSVPLSASETSFQRFYGGFNEVSSKNVADLFPQSTPATTPRPFFFSSNNDAAASSGRQITNSFGSPPPPSPLSPLSSSSSSSLTPSVGPGKKNLVFRKPIAVSKYDPNDDRANSLMSPLKSLGRTGGGSVISVGSELDDLLLGETGNSKVGLGQITSRKGSTERSGGTSGSSFSQFAAQFENLDAQIEKGFEVNPAQIYGGPSSLSVPRNEELSLSNDSRAVDAGSRQQHYQDYPPFDSGSPGSPHNPTSSSSFTHSHNNGNPGSSSPSSSASPSTADDGGARKKVDGKKEGPMVSLLKHLAEHSKQQQQQSSSSPDGDRAVSQAPSPSPTSSSSTTAGGGRKKSQEQPSRHESTSEGEIVTGVIPLDSKEDDLVVIRLEPVEFITPSEALKSSSSKSKSKSNKSKSKDKDKDGTPPPAASSSSPSTAGLFSSAASVRPYDSRKDANSRGGLLDDGIKGISGADFGKELDEILAAPSKFWRAKLLAREDAGPVAVAVAAEARPAVGDVIPVDDAFDELYNEMHSPFPAVPMSDTFDAMGGDSVSVSVQDPRQVVEYDGDGRPPPPPSPTTRRSSKDSTPSSTSTRTSFSANKAVHKSPRFYSGL